MECRPGCGICCVEISISSPLPGMPDGKPAGVRCVNLGKDGLCGIHNSPDYPDVCRNFSASKETCGNSAQEATRLIREWERLTR